MQITSHKPRKQCNVKVGGETIVGEKLITILIIMNIYLTSVKRLL